MQLERSSTRFKILEKLILEVRGGLVHYHGTYQSSKKGQRLGTEVIKVRVKRRHQGSELKIGAYNHATSLR